MKKLRYILFLSFFLWGCETSFEIEATEKEIPVVYGVLDINETKQYIRIERVYCIPLPRSSRNTLRLFGDVRLSKP